jgi:hypothetical protein
VFLSKAILRRPFWIPRNPSFLRDGNPNGGDRASIHLKVDDPAMKAEMQFLQISETSLEKGYKQLSSATPQGHDGAGRESPKQILGQKRRRKPAHPGCRAIRENLPRQAGR